MINTGKMQCRSQGPDRQGAAALAGERKNALSSFRYFSAIAMGKAGSGKENSDGRELFISQFYRKRAANPHWIFAARFLLLRLPHGLGDFLERHI